MPLDVLWIARGGIRRTAYGGMLKWRETARQIPFEVLVDGDGLLFRHIGGGDDAKGAQHLGPLIVRYAEEVANHACRDLVGELPV
ncbi:hypothetical protein ACFV1X_21300 [Streptomyces coelicoflavus]|uniref:hypothetical protein n=1 Tax=Streptomyces coelicoflavus TaxID=285562 RepID=UPI00369AAF1E